MAEVLLTMAILAVLMSVAFIGVIRYMRSMAQLERDGISKEIFIAAQNHLTMAEEQGYPVSATLSAGEETERFGTMDPENEGVWYFSVTRGDAFGKGTVLDQMLPFAAVDETVRAGGSFIVRYQAEPALVLDVFYCLPDGSRYGHSLSEGDYSACMELSRESKSARRSCLGNRAVLGWYGGEYALNLTKGKKIETPLVKVENGDTLSVRITNPNAGTADVQTTLIITGKTSGRKVSVPLTMTSLSDHVKYDAAEGAFTVILDDVTDAGGRGGLHFSELFPEDTTGLIPGEDIEVQAVAYNNSALTNIAYSAVETTNSLFGNPDGSGAARIGSIRHLENLDKEISKVDYSRLHISKAEQFSDLDWTKFLDGVGNREASIIYSGSLTGGSKKGTYLPVNAGEPLSYDGKKHTISGIRINTSDPAGLFGHLTDGASVKSLMLSDFRVESEGSSAGTLAGTAEGAILTDIASIGKDASVTSSGAAGGLVGTADKTTLDACAAAVIVKSKGGAAGGLVGHAAAAVIKDSYAGGHTADGKYGDTYNVTASGAAGGLVGSAQGSAIDHSYATASAAGTAAGGLIGTAGGSGSSVSGCYASGKVSGTGSEGSLFGTFSGTLSDCSYFGIVNERINETDGSVTYLNAGTGAEDVTAFDDSLEAFRTFTGEDREEASPYDTVLIRNYQGQYSLKGIGQLDPDLDEKYYVNIHYGDWPSPETFFLNAAC